ncbi:MAG: hypothetical protein NTX61_01905 [Bacteroidetes bacterium]|nr:hypothetical protein [Bacteroidota bacterium]
MKKGFLLGVLLCFPFFIFSQVAFQDLNYQNIYDFLDEMANLGFISLNSSNKPYSREFIAIKLNEVELHKDVLNKRQKKELNFFLRDYNFELKPGTEYSKDVPGLFKKQKNFGIPFSPPELLYKDSLFRIFVRPVLGIRYYYRPDSSVYHRWDGAEILGYIGKHIGFYASLRDNHETQLLVTPDYFTRDEGAAWKGGGDYSEMRGGIAYSWNNGSFFLGKDHFQWGDNYFGSIIFSGRTPSFPYFQLRLKPLKWLEYTYIHGWLISQVIDSSRTWRASNTIREYYLQKYLAAAMLTFAPWKNLHISLGNSVVYSAGYPNPAFLLPFLFPVNFRYHGDAYQSSYYGNNSQLFLNISSRQVRHLHLYGSLFMDGFNWKVFTASNRHNPISYKAGFRLSDFLIQNISVTGEYTLTNPWTYEDQVPTLTYTSNLYNLGSFMSDNSRDICMAIDYKPIRGLVLNLTFEMQEHGREANAITEDPSAVPLLTGLTWKSRIISATATYEFTNNTYVFLGIINNQSTGDKKYISPYFYGNRNTLSGGLNVGF